MLRNLPTILGTFGTVPVWHAILISPSIFYFIRMFKFSLLNGVTVVILVTFVESRFFFVTRVPPKPSLGDFYIIFAQILEWPLKSRINYSIEAQNGDIYIHGMGH